MEDFKTFTHTHQALLHEVFRMQKRLREVTLGSISWQAMADRRIELRPNYHIKISALMTLVSVDVCFQCVYL